MNRSLLIFGSFLHDFRMLFPTPRQSLFRRSLILLALLGLAASAPGQGITRAADEADYDAYHNGWETGHNGGNGFQPWQLFRPEFTGEDAERRFAGFFLAREEVEGNLGLTAQNGRAFGIFANGTGFEETLAFRRFWDPLRFGEVFSWKMTFQGFESKFEEDAADVKSVGLILRGNSDVAGIESMESDRRLVVAAVEGFSTYQIFDREGRFNTRIFLDPAGALFVVTLQEHGSYRIEIQTLSTGEVHRFEGRQLSPGDGPIHGFALFNRNAGVHNVYFGSFRIDRPFRLIPESSPPQS
jgi:hypothetical protein